MKVEPIRHYPRPQLPTREIVDEHPEILRLLPKRWQSNSAVVAALTACLLLSSRASAKGNGEANPLSRIAPIFVHGGGRADFGGDTLMSPVMLPEDEARQVIVEEAKKAGIRFEKEGDLVPNVVLPVPATAYDYDASHGLKKTGAQKQETKTFSIKMDGLDAKHGIQYEYVSGKDFADLEGDATLTESDGDYNLVGLAADLRESLVKARPAGTYAVFYDPVGGPYEIEQLFHYKVAYKSNDQWTKEFPNIHKLAKESARENLRRQVQDFIKWLKAQGVI